MGPFPHTSSEHFPNGIDVQGTTKVHVLQRDPVDLEIVAAAVAVDLSRSSLFRLALTGAAAIAAPTGAYEGMEGRMVFTQDATGGRDVTWNAAWEWGPNGRPDFDNDAAGAVTVIDYQVISDSKVLVSAIRGTNTSAQDQVVEDLAVTTLAVAGAATVGTTLGVTGALTAASINGVTILTGAADPSAGAGVAATMPALYFRVTGGAGTLWYKNAAGDTAWTAADPLD